MISLLDAVLTPLITEERKEVILDNVHILEELNYVNALDELNLVINVADGMYDNSILLDRIDEVINQANNYILGQHEIKVAETTTAYQKLSIIKTILGLEFYVIPEQILLLIGGEFDNESILANIVPMFGFESYDEILPCIHEVSDSFITSLTTLLNNNTDSRQEIVEYATPVSKVTLINKCFNYWGKDRFKIIATFTDAGMRIGNEYTTLYELVAEKLNDTELEDVVYEMLGIALFSNLPKHDVWKYVNRMIEQHADGNQFNLRDMNNELKSIKNVMSEWMEFRQ